VRTGLSGGRIIMISVKGEFPVSMRDSSFR
jgi:hypothetical protein